MKLKLSVAIIATLTFAAAFAQHPVTVTTTDGLEISGTITQRSEEFIRIKLSEGITRIIYNNKIASIEEAKVRSISFSRIPWRMKTGESRMVVAETSPKEAGYKISFTSSNPEVATIDANGLIKALSSGVTTIIAKADNAACSERIIVVSKDEPEEKTKYNATRTIQKTKPAKEPKQAKIFEPIKRRFEMSAEFATSIEYWKTNEPWGNATLCYASLTSSFIMGYRHNQTLFIGGGIGFSKMADSHSSFDTDENKTINLSIPNFDVNIFATLRTYFTKKLTEKRVSPFAAFSLGGHFSASSGLLVNPQIGINIRTREHNNDSLYIAFGFNGQTIKYEEITKTRFDDRDYHTNIDKGNKFAYGFDFRIGYTF